MIEENLHHMRKDYSPIPLEKESMKKDPFEQFASWFGDAVKYESLEANAMVVATANSQGQPQARYVLLKSYSWDGFVFFTNYNSRKGKDIEQNNKVTLLFFWPQTMRQVRIEGVAKKTTPEESDLYFNSRPFASQASSALSKQSEHLKDRVEFDNSVTKLETSNVKIKRPDHWGGYLVKAHSFEFWQGGIGRSHDRFLYTLQLQKWDIIRLFP